MGQGTRVPHRVVESALENGTENVAVKEASRGKVSKNVTRCRKRKNERERGEDEGEKEGSEGGRGKRGKRSETDLEGRSKLRIGWSTDGNRIRAQLAIDSRRIPGKALLPGGLAWDLSRGKSTTTDVFYNLQRAFSDSKWVSTCIHKSHSPSNLSEPFW
ncbi:hypothetical protein HZH68_010970 [Vespula germanica]|uniref:Uncharacterized protein n=1 Tax=Vespula germanica TaxID=30212 RepID=A0A834N010_VESGE|nr:hypothetical protein HZH68_010970 [Vespula germanica]